jgi:hypothetical protein
MSKAMRYIMRFGAKLVNEETWRVYRLRARHRSSRRAVFKNNIETIITTHDDEDHQVAVLAVRPLIQEDLRALENAEPPHLAEFLLTALAFSRRAEHVIGDLNEQYAREYREFGAKRADRRYWAKALQSLIPLLVRAAGKALKWGAVIDMVRRHL